MSIFIGGATGATGKVFVELAHAAGLDVRPHVRPRSVHKWTAPPEPCVFDLDDADALDEALAGVSVVVCAIGSMRKRFKTGDTYEHSDIGATRILHEASVRNGVDRYLLVGASGADWIPGPYYDAKRKGEAIARSGGVSWSIFRPSMLERAGDGGSLRWIGSLPVPGRKGWWNDARPIPVEVVAESMLEAIEADLHRDAIVSGRDMWPLSEAWHARMGD